MSRLTGLQRLRLDSCGEVALPGCLSALSRLECVNLRQCRAQGPACLDALLSIPSLRVRRMTLPGRLTGRSLLLLTCRLLAAVGSW